MDSLLSNDVTLPNPSPGPDDLIIVGIGASAGGVEALKTFFANVPENTGIAYVVILHLTPNLDSKLAEVLQDVTKMRVIQVTEQQKVKANHVYVVPPNQHLVMIDGSVSVSSSLEVEDKRAPVDIFFRTLASTHGPRAICVVLSGTGANGSMGLKKIKECGGAAFVQNPREAEFNEMPRNAISTELVDAILSVADIPARIIAYKQSLTTVHIPAETEKHPEDQQQALRDIFTQLRIRTGHDFTNYKRPTLLRRIERRINVCNFTDVKLYAAYLHHHPEETNALLKDLLISVTNFFRDKKAFDTLQTDFLPPIIKSKTSQGAVRIWVAGCATGEEAYSLAILCAEQVHGMIDAPKIQIFATDIDQAAINVAREGLYTINDAADVNPERLRRFFTKDGNGYRIRREIREMILFATHNFLKDPPFSHLDIVSCRNVLIYLNQTAQKRVLETFHFALNPGGFLFLGSAESADNAHDLFSISSREYHVFQKRHITAGRPLPVPDSVPYLKVEKVEKPSGAFEKPILKGERLTFGDLHVALVEEYAPPSIVVNDEYDIVHVSERAGRFLQIAGGEPSHNLLKLIRPELRLELRSALYQAVQYNAPVEAKSLKVTIDEQTETITIHIRPVTQPGHVAKGFILVLFERVADDSQESQTKVIRADEPIAKHLEDELIRLKSQLRASNEQHELHAEELKASNEELQAMNEELRSAAEELETSKEELQSINEELRTVNQELKLKVEETTLTSNNLQNLINSVDIGTIFLDRGFKVAFFTPAARDLFNLLPADYGRPLSDITTKLEYDDLIADVEFVLEKLQPIEREIHTKDERNFIMRVLPYRTSEDRINGVVITFINISNVKKTEAALRNSEERLRLLIESAKDYAIFTLDTNRIVNSWNTGAQTMFGYSEQEIIGEIGDIMFVPEDREKGAPVWETDKAVKEGVAENERWHIRKDGSRFYGSGAVRPLYDANKSLLGFVKIMRDLTESKRNEDSVRESEARFRTVANLIPDLLWTNDPSGTRDWHNQRWHDYTGQSAEAAAGNGWLDVLHPEDRKQFSEAFNNAIKLKKSFRQECRIYNAAEREYHWFLVKAEPVVDDSQNVSQWLGAATDIDEIRKAQEAIGESEERLRITLESAEMGTWDYAVLRDEVMWNQQHFIMLGLSPDDQLKSIGYFMQFVHEEDRPHLAEQLQKAADKGNIFQDEFRIIRADNGNIRWMSGYGRTVATDAAGRASRMVGVMYDITERKKLEQQKEEFIGIASHELKTPVTSIKGYTQILQHRFDKAKDVESSLLMQKLNNQVDRLTNLIKDLLDTTKIVEGRLSLNISQFNLDALISERIEDWQRMSDKHRLVFNKGKIPVLKADQERIEQVLNNLISNAIKYSPEGSEIIIKTSLVGSSIQVSVQDHGIGVPEEAMQKIFERFFRVVTPGTEAFAGMGLGLYISAGIIQRHGGTISVKSKLGEGSTFLFTLPVNDA